MRNGCLATLLMLATPALAAYDANGVTLGVSEKAVKAKFPSAHCKPLEWQTLAADRRCDDAKMAFGAVEARITFYLRKDSVEAFDVRFDTKDTDKVVAFLKARYGAPTAESREKIERKGKPAREVYKVLWDTPAEHARISAQLEKKRSSLTVWRGDFEEEIYRVRP